MDGPISMFSISMECHNVKEDVCEVAKQGLNRGSDGSRFGGRRKIVAMKAQYLGNRWSDFDREEIDKMA